MTFELKVTGQDEAHLLIEQDWPTRIVSLTNSPSLWYGYHHLHVPVHDIAFVAEHAMSPSLDHLKAVLIFTRGLTSNDRLLVHCHAGQSRSTAIAIAILIQHGMSYKEAFDHVESVRSILMPNQLFIQIIDQHFNLSGSLVKYATEHRTASLKRTLMLPSDAPTKQSISDMKAIMGILQ